MLRDRLRAHTRSHHEHIERVLDLPASVRSRDDYMRLLMRFYGFYAPMEATLSEYAPELLRVDIQVFPRLKASKLRGDLQLLGLGTGAIDALARCRSLPSITSWQHALGSLYVLEGSTLGGQVIAEDLRSRLGIGREEMHFLLAYDDQTGSFWQTFVQAVNALELSDAGVANALQGAEDTFEALTCWLANLDSRPIWTGSDVATARKRQDAK